ncbi:uncharacterized protein LOC107714402 [Sinocyclocheilus rhinocerous]|uniref:uncharacterized protein LOC107714402 n=1 Tax=Sinocyclocheilus rhinocerous TaxID=307959 RepID=UPI0007B997C8|nr:PREDICTED: uncharacterized protein LOC107714402 [Sinocyclocheilus rhinocerous]
MSSPKPTISVPPPTKKMKMWSLGGKMVLSCVQEPAERDTEMLTSHLTSLGFRINYAKSQLIPSQEIEYLGLRIDSVAYRAVISERRIMAFYQCLAQFRKGNLVSSPPFGHDGFVAVRGPARFDENERLPAMGSSETSVSSSAPSAQRKSKRKRIISPADSPSLAGEAVAGRDCPAPSGRALAAPVAPGPAVASRGADISPTPGTSRSLGLARERLNLYALGLLQEVINTIQSARAPSTRSLYGLKWHVFEDWCIPKGVIPFQCAVSDVLWFLQSLINNGRTMGTISACHVGFEGVSVGQHPFICRFTKVVKHLRPVSKHLVPSWDLSIVLNALTRAPFEPLESVDIKLLSLKRVILLALVSAKRVCELHALSVHRACLDFSPDDSKVTLLPNPAFVPNVSDSAYNCSALELLPFYPPPFSSEEERKLHTLCPVRALCYYVNRTRSFRKNDQFPFSRGLKDSFNKGYGYLVGIVQGDVGNVVSMDGADAEDYDKVKEAILIKYEINAEIYRQRFRSSEILLDETPRELYVRLKYLFSKSMIRPQQKKQPSWQRGTWPHSEMPSAALEVGVKEG